ncbi:MAG TPA: isoprenylcysteine carboxylmethyltransferase family protein [Candidatus Acidoferrales bacterium]|nr:isoprenylcysteine carboxylmethyltransferase family protein [Candidatus Acidoferrales bacterium]
MKSLFLVFRTLVYATGFVWLWWWLAMMSRRYDRAIPWRLPAFAPALGIVIGIAGAILLALCLGEFVTRGQGTPAPFDAPRRFVAIGPYRYVRNPMYIGALSVLVGFALYLRSPSVLGLVLAAFLAFHAFVLAYEEPALRAKFGAEYEDYCRRVRRWLPRLPEAS